MVVTLEGGCRVSDMRDGKSLTEGTLRLWKQIGRETGTQAISLQVMEFAPGLSPTILNDDSDQILYLLGNSFRETADQSDEFTDPHYGATEFLINGFSNPVGPDTGIYLRPAETFAVNNSGSDTIVVISSQCPDPERKPRFVTASEAISSKAERSPMVRLGDRIQQSTADRWYRVMVDEQVGSMQVTQFVGSIPPGRAPDHFHNYEEVLFILKGEGQMWAGETHTPIAAGSCIFLPKQQAHCVENTGSGELRLLGIFYPAGSPSVRYET